MPAYTDDARVAHVIARFERLAREDLPRPDELYADGRIAQHRDDWDAAEELYEKLPAIGALMRWLKRRARR